MVATDISGFCERSLEDLVAAGRVTASHARIWMRVARPGAHRVEIETMDGSVVAVERVEVPAEPRFDGTHSFVVPARDGERLLASTVHRARVVRESDGERIGACRFVTAPEEPSSTPSRVAFGLMSCHQPFGADGRISEQAVKLLPLARETLHELDVSRVIMMGDQMYSDYPPELSLFDDEFFAHVAPPGRRSIFECTREEVRALYQARYRAFWQPPDVQALHSGWASELILDDHEIVDNFGAHPEHSGPRFRAIRAGALDAYFDYQALRAMPRRNMARPEAFYRSFTFGTVAVFVMDLRSERRASAERIEFYSEAQLEALRHFFHRHRDKHALVLVLSVPILHVPDWLATAGAYFGGEASDAADRWSYAKANGSRDRLLTLLYEQRRAQPEQRVVLVGGDIHVGLASRICWSDGRSPEMLELVSSAISNHCSPFLQRLASLAPRMLSTIGTSAGLIAKAELLSSVDVDDQNPCGRLNFAVLEFVRRTAHVSDVRMRLFSHTDGHPPRPIAVFDSGLL